MICVEWVVVAFLAEDARAICCKEETEQIHTQRIWGELKLQQATMESLFWHLEIHQVKELEKVGLQNCSRLKAKFNIIARNDCKSKSDTKRTKRHEEDGEKHFLTSQQHLNRAF
jgi:endo-1,4-beta-mannosidase